jgi:DNA-binding Xre family transcriptional regulator
MDSRIHKQATVSHLLHVYTRMPTASINEVSANYKTRLARKERIRFPCPMPNYARRHLFPAALDSVMQSRGINQVTLSAKAGLAVSRVNNYLQGNYRTITPAHLAAICKALGSTPADSAALIQAYAYDLLPEKLRGMVDIRVLGAREAGKWEVPSKGLPPAFAAEFVDLYKLTVSNSKVRQRTAEWIQLMRETKGSRSASR